MKNEYSNFSFRMNQDERRILGELAKIHERSPSSYLRWLLRREYEKTQKDEDAKVAWQSK